MRLSVEQELYANSMKRLLGLDDWEIVYQLIDDKLGDALAQELSRPDYREAVITISLPALRESQAKGFADSVERLLLHELCEVKVEECFRDVDTSLADSAALLRARDLVADSIRRIVERVAR